MRKYFIVPEYADEPWDGADTIEDARIKRDNLASVFVNRHVAITDSNWNEVE